MSSLNTLEFVSPNTSSSVLCSAELDRPREAAGAGWVDWQLWTHTSQAYDAGDRAAVSARLHLPAAQRGESQNTPPTPFCSDISSSLVPVLLTWTLMGVPAGRHPVCDRDEASSPGLILSPSSLTSFNGIHSGCLVLLCIIFDNTNNLKCHTDDKIT